MAVIRRESSAMQPRIDRSACRQPTRLIRKVNIEPSLIARARQLLVKAGKGWMSGNLAFDLRLLFSSICPRHSVQSLFDFVNSLRTRSTPPGGSSNPNENPGFKTRPRFCGIRWINWSPFIVRQKGALSPKRVARSRAVNAAISVPSALSNNNGWNPLPST
jgi:hypothetical protein